MKLSKVQSFTSIAVALFLTACGENTTTEKIVEVAVVEYGTQMQAPQVLIRQVRIMETPFVFLKIQNNNL